MTNVILVDEKDNSIGVMEKLEAHKNGGRLHRAFSIFVFNKKGEMLLQHRAKSKYHCGGLWTNTCCSHPSPNEDTADAVHRRLKEEMGFDCDLNEILSFIYKAKVNNELTEWEFDHVFIGNFDREIKINPEEADDFKWISTDDLKKDIKKNPEKYTPWFKIILERVLEYGK